MSGGTTRPSTCRCPWWATRNWGSRRSGRRWAATRTPADWTAYAKAERKAWDAYVAENVAHGKPAELLRAGHRRGERSLCDPRDRVVTAAGGLPAEVTANWRTLDIGTVDVEFGFSCMGYEIAGGWGARIAQSEASPTGDTIVFVGDGSYLLDELRHLFICPDAKKLIILVLDNGGFAVINKLQNNTGNESFNNLIADCPTVPEAFAVDFEAHARAWAPMPSRWPTRPNWPRRSRRQGVRQDHVIVMQVDPYEGWTTQGHTWWEVGTPQVSDNPNVREKACRDRGRTRQAAAGGLMMKLSRQPLSSSSAVRGWTFYPDPPGTKTEHATQFFACLGGSSANIGVAICKLGGAADLVTCVSDDAIGRFALNQLDHYGVGRAMCAPSAARRAIRWPWSRPRSRITSRSSTATARPISR
jgi:hypothetical protein